MIFVSQESTSLIKLNSLCLELGVIAIIDGDTGLVIIQKESDENEES